MDGKLVGQDGTTELLNPIQPTPESRLCGLDSPGYIQLYQSTALCVRMLQDKTSTNNRRAQIELDTLHQNHVCHQDG